MSNITQITPGTSVSIVAPPIVIAGVQVNVGGVVGTASMGPVNVPTAVNGSNFQSIFGVPQARKYDGGTIVAEAALNGASTIYFTRVTDGTDTKANIAVNNATLIATSTGSAFNNTAVSFASGGKANSITVTVSQPGIGTEVFPNLPASNSSVFWSAANNAINGGAGVLRGPSNIVDSNASNASALPTVPSTVNLTGGSDGVAGVGANSVVGTDGVVKTGMYTLRGLGIQYAVLADCDASNTWTQQSSYGEAEFILMGAVMPAGGAQATGNAVTTKQTAGLDSFNAVLLQGDWAIYNDPIYGQRKVSPQGYWLGIRSSLLPHQSVLNKTINGIVATERSLSTGPYSTAETDTLAAAGIEVICNPIQRGASFGCKIGRNTSSLVGANSDTYSTMTNFLAQTCLKAGSPYIGEPNNSQTQTNVTASFNHFFNSLVSQGILALNDDGSFPFIITCNAGNNSQTSEALGNLNVSIQVTFQSIVWYFNVALQGGAAVVTMTSNVN